MQDLEDVLQQATSQIENATDFKNLEIARIHYLGKKGILTEYLKKLGTLPQAERKNVGQKLNDAKELIQSLIETRIRQLEKIQVEEKLKSETLDITLAGRKQSKGSIHPVQQTMQRLRTIFTQWGFGFMQGPEIEDEYYNFTALNIPALHPARTTMDTFYFSEKKVLRTHMSPVEIRSMQQLKPPFRIVAMGKVYRRDFDLTHTPMFHQMEVLMIDVNISLAHLKNLLTQFLEAFFYKNIPIRFRPSYFPFTEPSAEVDIGCFNCKGKGCRICKKTGWLEVLGSGMVHPNVLKEVNIDSKKYSGFAIGAGIDRLALLKYGIKDLRSLFENDLRFLKQF